MKKRQRISRAFASAFYQLILAGADGGQGDKIKQLKEGRV